MTADCVGKQFCSPVEHKCLHTQPCQSDKGPLDVIGAVFDAVAKHRPEIAQGGGTH